MSVGDPSNDAVNAAGAESALDVPRWFYVIHGRRLGPISSVEITQLLLRGPYDPQMLVWRRGMIAWAPVSQTAELMLPGLPSSSVPQLLSAPLTVDRQLRNARINCVAIAVALGLACLLLIGAGVGGAGAPLAGRLFVTFALTLLPAIFVAIYLPLRIRVIQSLPVGYRVAGFLGGLGMIVLCLGTLVAALTVA
ncbi:MAG: DUF4339 domain-containing protein [Phycisphaerae bacterium]|nr:DUF4339 domain-containing protein [Phycisphaerae bacterium]